MPKRAFSLVAAPGTYKTYGAKRRKRVVRRAGYSTVPRTRGPYSMGEMKYFDTTKGPTGLVASTNWTGTELDPATYNTLLAPTVGSAINQRVGREVKVHKVKVRGYFTAGAQVDQTAADGPCYIRLLLVQDTQTNASQMQGEDVMDGSSGAAALAPTAFQSLANFGRFRVLKDKVILLQNPNMSYDGTNIEQFGLVKTFKMTCRFKKPVSVRFNATNGGSVADIVDNSWHIIGTCNSTALVPQINYSARVCYKE